jgi:hypothetical protein
MCGQFDPRRLPGTFFSVHVVTTMTADKLFADELKAMVTN